jgi:hypothetical protein
MYNPGHYVGYCEYHEKRVEATGYQSRFETALSRIQSRSVTNQTPPFVIHAARNNTVELNR